MRRSQPPPSPPSPCPPCPPPPSPPSGSSFPQAAGHQFSQEGRIFPKRATTSRLYRRRRKISTWYSLPSPMQPRWMPQPSSETIRKSAKLPLPAFTCKINFSQMPGAQWLEKCWNIGSVITQNLWLLWGLPILLEEAGKASIYLWVRQGYFRTEGARHLLRAPCMFCDREMTNIRRRTKYTLSMGGASKRSAGRWPDLMNWISTCANDQAQFWGRF